jgi:hypothetical protein
MAIPDRISAWQIVAMDSSSSARPAIRAPTYQTDRVLMMADGILVPRRNIIQAWRFAIRLARWQLWIDPAERLEAGANALMEVALGGAWATETRVLTPARPPPG